METWNSNNLPENHSLVENVRFIAMTEGTWNRKKQDGTNETVPKWDYVTSPDDNGLSLQVGVYSSTDHEAIKLDTPYDLIVKKAVGKDGTFYGYSLKGFGAAGQPIPKKEPQSRFQKGLKLNAKAEALKAAAQVFSGLGTSPEDVILVAEVMEAWLNGEYTPPAESGDQKDTTAQEK